MSASQDVSRREIRVPGLAEPLSHYTDVVVHGDLAFISGCLGVDARGVLAGADVESQARQALANLGLALAACGSSPDQVLKVTVYLTDVDDRARVNPARREFFGSTRPASTLVQVGALAVPGAAIEIEAVAAVPA